MTDPIVDAGGSRARLDPPALLRAMFDAALAAAGPDECIPPHLPPLPAGRTVVVGAGKASAAMARAFEQHWRGPFEGLVVTRYGHAVPCERIEVVEAGHPVPDEAGRRAAERMLDMVAGLGAQDLVVALMSGGGSALLTVPPAGVSLSDVQQLTRTLLRCGATIGQLNAVRRRLSAAAGGRLAAAAYPAQVCGLLISDVPGDDPAVIASGPTVPAARSDDTATAVLERLGVDVPDSIRAYLAGSPDGPQARDERSARTTNVVVAAAQRSLEAAAEVARRAGVMPVILGDAIEGEARELGTVLGGVAAQVVRHGQPVPAPCVLLSGGETTVTVRGGGIGGRNVEFLLALTLAVRGCPQVWALACDTDGVDGGAEVAGALTGPRTLARAAALDLDAERALDDNDAHTFFAALGDQVVTGPTHTNVNDFRAVLIS